MTQDKSKEVEGLIEDINRSINNSVCLAHQYYGGIFGTPQQMMDAIVPDICEFVLARESSLKDKHEAQMRFAVEYAVVRAMSERDKYYATLRKRVLEPLMNMAKQMLPEKYDIEPRMDFVIQPEQSLEEAIAILKEGEV